MAARTSAVHQNETTLASDRVVLLPTATPPTRREPYGSSQRLPDSLRKYLIKVQGDKLYLPAAYRLAWFREERPDWGVMTELVEGGHQTGYATIRAVITNAEGMVIATGMKTETQADFPGGMLEKAETGAIGRALAVAGYGSQYYPDLDDASEADKPAGDLWKGPGQCPKCHAPEGKRHGKPCKG